MSDAITPEKIEQIAALARLGLHGDEAQKYAKQMTSILDYMEILKELAVEGVEMTTQVTGLNSVFRPDEIAEYANPDQLLNCSPLTKLNHSIVVKAIIKE